MIVAWLLGCGRGDPDLAAKREVLEAWAAASAALEAGDPVAAGALLEPALASRPDDPVLLAWSGKALADAGDLEGAIARIDQALAVAPQFAEARYNRAAWLARAGRPDEAGPELERALESGVRPRREVLSDPDFAPWREHPSFGFLPREAMAVAVEAPTESVFWGSEVPLRLRIVGASALPVAIAGAVSGPVEVVQAIEEIRLSTDGPIHDLTWSLRVVGAGTAVIGPIEVRSGASVTQVDAIEVVCVAPPDKVGSNDRILALWGPDARAADWPAPFAIRQDGLLWVKTVPGDRVEVVPAPPPPVMHLEHREGGTVSWSVSAWRTGPATVRVLRMGAERYRETVQ